MYTLYTGYYQYMYLGNPSIKLGSIVNIGGTLRTLAKICH